VMYPAQTSSFFWVGPYITGSCVARRAPARRRLLPTNAPCDRNLRCRRIRTLKAGRLA